MKKRFTEEEIIGLMPAAYAKTLTQKSGTLAMIYFNVILAGTFFLLLAFGYVIFTLIKCNRESASLDDMLESSGELIIECQLRSENAFQYTEKGL